MIDDFREAIDGFGALVDMRREHRRKPKLHDIVINFASTKNRTLAIIEQLKSPLKLAFKDVALDKELEIERQQLMEAMGIDLPPWRATVIDAVEDLKKGDQGNIIIAVNPFENNEMKSMARSFVGRNLFKKGQPRFGATDGAGVVGIEINSLIVNKIEAEYDQSFYNDFLVALYTAQINIFYNSTIRPQNNVDPMKFLTRGELKSEYKNGFRLGGGHGMAGVFGPKTIIF